MATPEEIAALRAMIGEPNDVEPWTDAALGALIDANDGDLNVSAYTSWTNKAATYSGMVDTTESGSSRRLSQLQEQALKMAAHYQSVSSTPEVSDLTGYAYTLPIERV